MVDIQTSHLQQFDAINGIVSKVDSSNPVATTSRIHPWLPHVPRGQ